jgi:dCMP deaminase
MIRTYADALFSIKRGFLIIGLTGYTASGCTAVANILAKTKKPEFPGIEEVRDIIDEFRLKKLQHVWDELEWQKFTNIEIAKVIFLIAIYDSIRFNFKKGIQAKLSEISAPHKTIFSAAKYLVEPNFSLYRSDYAEKVVTAYEQAKSLYGIFKSKTGLNLEQFIELMQNWGDEIRKFGRILSKSTAMKVSPENILVLPEAVRRLIKAYRIVKNSKLFFIDAFRNPFEVEFFKRRYNEFYLIGVQREPSALCVRVDVASEVKNLGSHF